MGELLSGASAECKLKRAEHPRAAIIRAIHAGCMAADIHLTCSYPGCNCKQMPKAIEAALGAYVAE